MKPDPATALVSSEAGRLLSTLIEINHEITSILDLDELLNKIAELTNRIIPYEIFAIFKIAVVVQQIYFRYVRGQTHDERFAAFGPRVEGLARAALELAKQSKL